MQTDETSTVSESISRKEASVSAIRAAAARESDGFRILYVLMFLNRGGRVEGVGKYRRILGDYMLLPYATRLQWRPGADQCSQ